MMRFSTLAIVLAVAALATTSSSSQEAKPASERPQPAANSERPMSIFNDKVRRFKFDLEETCVTAETVEDFLISYRASKQPAIIGAYADAETNSLVVISAPEAEEAVRVHLATWIVDRQGLASSSLKVKKRELEFRRRALLGEMAELDVLLVEADAAKAEQLQARLAIFKTQLSVVEQQIGIVNRYIERQGEATIDTTKFEATTGEQRGRSDLGKN
jgi:hypothetical protein